MMLLLQKYYIKQESAMKNNKKRLFLEKVITKNKNCNQKAEKRTKGFNELSRALLEGTFNIKRDG